jgi:acetolactate synthase-1/2/3 large subunit
MLVTSGPGATNAVTPLQDALMDSIPLVCISGQVPTTLIGSDAFQECDTVGITRPAPSTTGWSRTSTNWRASCTRPSVLRRPAVPARLSSTFQRISSSQPAPTRLRGETVVTRATAEAAGRPEGNPGGYRTDGDGEAARSLYGRRRINSGPEASRLLRELVELTDFPDYLDADGARRLSGFGQELARHARHARHLRSEHGDA